MQEKYFKNVSNKDLLKNSEFYNKIVLIEGEWKYEEDQRNACLRAARDDKIDYLIIQDCDEFYSDEDFLMNLSDISKES